VRRHHVAIPVSLLTPHAGDFVLEGATQAAIKALPAFRVRGHDGVAAGGAPRRDVDALVRAGGPSPSCSAVGSSAEVGAPGRLPARRTQAGRD
jgi:hypothetical protein